MNGIHFHNIKGGGTQNFLFIGENDGLQYIDGLCYVGHFHAVGVVVENIEGRACQHGIAHGVLLVKEPRVGARFNIVPAAPFIHKKVYFFIRIVFVHNGRMPLNEFFHFKGALHGGEVLVFRKFGSRSLFAPVNDRIMV